jgi:hypothetical protein
MELYLVFLCQETSASITQIDTCRVGAFHYQNDVDKLKSTEKRSKMIKKLQGLIYEKEEEPQIIANCILSVFGHACREF